MYIIMVSLVNKHIAVLRTVFCVASLNNLGLILYILCKRIKLVESSKSFQSLIIRKLEKLDRRKHDNKIRNFDIQVANIYFLTFCQKKKRILVKYVIHFVFPFNPVSTSSNCPKKSLCFVFSCYGRIFLSIFSIVSGIR